MGRGNGDTRHAFESRSDDVSAVLAVVCDNTERIANLGCWPDYISRDSLTSRVPIGSATAPGFDAGIACAMSLIPENKQRLAAGLHAAYTPELVEQVVSELGKPKLDADSEVTWWLAACHVCSEGSLTEAVFLNQVEKFKVLAVDDKQRVIAARTAANEMLNSFYIDEAGLAFGTEDGCMQGAYIAGHRVAGTYSEEYDMYFVGTFEDSLGLENFGWKDFARSGPVHGSKQFVKCCDRAEYESVAEIVVPRFKSDAKNRVHGARSIASSQNELDYKSSEPQL